MDSSPGVALCLLCTRVVVIRGRIGALVPRRFLKDARVAITAFTLLDGGALRVLRKPIFNPEQAEGLNPDTTTVTHHRVKNTTLLLFKQIWLVSPAEGGFCRRYMEASPRSVAMAARPDSQLLRLTSASAPPALLAVMNKRKQGSEQKSEWLNFSSLTCRGLTSRQR